MASELKKKAFWRAVVAEFLAMSLFIFISIGSALGFQFPVIANKTITPIQDNVKVSLAFGISIATMAQSVGHISGAHLNPAVTLGLLLSCQISILRAVMYIVAQCLGAVVGTAILSGITSNLESNLLGLNQRCYSAGLTSSEELVAEILSSLENQQIPPLTGPANPNYSLPPVESQLISWVSFGFPAQENGIQKQLAPGINAGQGLGIEIIATLQLVLCVLATTDKRRTDLSGSAPLAIGLSVALGHLLAIDYTGCSINPARSFGSALVTTNFADHWVFWVGPLLGGAAAALIYDFILAPRSSEITDRMKVWTTGNVEEYDLDADDSRVEMKPK